MDGGVGESFSVLEDSMGDFENEEKMVHGVSNSKSPACDAEDNLMMPSADVSGLTSEKTPSSIEALMISAYVTDDFKECSGCQSSNYNKKMNEILAALEGPTDRKLLRSLARSEGGLLNDHIRRKVWPQLLDFCSEDDIYCAPDDTIEKHDEYHQVILDVNRSLKRFPPGISDYERMILQEELLKLILSVITKHPYLHYYQGYHDVAVTLLLVVGDENRTLAVADDDKTEECGDSLGSFDEDIKEESSLGVSKEVEDGSVTPTSVDDHFSCDTGSPDENFLRFRTNVRPKSQNLSIPKDFREVKDVRGQSESPGEIITNGKRSDFNESLGQSLNELVGSVTSSGIRVDSHVDSGRISSPEWENMPSFNGDSVSSERLISMWCNQVALKMLEAVSLKHFKECMECTMEATFHLLHHIFPIVEREDSDLCKYLDNSGVGTMFCLPWILTWYSHNINSHSVVVRLYDYFLASPVGASLYFAAAIILHRRKDIFATECEMPALHSLLSKIPDDLPFEEVLAKASALYEAYPLEALKKDVELRLSSEQRKMEEMKSSAARSIVLASNSVPGHYALLERLVPWFILPNRLRGLTRVIPGRQLRKRFILAAIPIAVYYVYSQLATTATS